MSAATPWPEGVIARYLTLAGVTVDLRIEGRKTAATCTACPAHREQPWTNDDGAWNTAQEMAEHETRRWAQDHAGKCRALPQPHGGLGHIGMQDDGEES